MSEDKLTAQDTALAYREGLDVCDRFLRDYTEDHPLRAAFTRFRGELSDELARTLIPVIEREREALTVWQEELSEFLHMPFEIGEDENGIPVLYLNFGEEGGREAIWLRDVLRNRVRMSSSISHHDSDGRVIECPYQEHPENQWLLTMDVLSWPDDWREKMKSVKFERMGGRRIWKEHLLHVIADQIAPVVRQASQEGLEPPSSEASEDANGMTGQGLDLS